MIDGVKLKILCLLGLRLQVIASPCGQKPAICCQGNRHFSVTPYIMICPSTETYFELYLRGAMSTVTGIYFFRLLLNIIFFVLRSFCTLTNSAYRDEMPHDSISPVYKCKKTCTKNIFHN